MPSSDELPEPLASLARRNAVEIRHTSWRSDIDRLIRAIEEIERQHGGSEGVRATSDEKQDPDPREHAAEDQPAELLHPMFRVRAVPVLEVVPTRIDFGRTKLGQHHAATVDVANAGSGELKWRYRKKGDFFDLKRSGDRLTVTLAYLAGKHRGSISIQSNGGETAVEVLAQIAWPLA
jgi:hypothetical protein